MKNCGTCKWWGGVNRNSACLFPLPDWVKRELHDPLRGGGALAATMRSDYGEDCATYEEYQCKSRGGA